MTVSRPRSLLAVVALALASACSFHNVATHWNGRVGENGQPVFVRTVTNIGLNLAVVVPLLGSITLDEMVDEATTPIAEAGSDSVRVIETRNENYWHGFPPFTWFLTPVITEVSIEYRPSAQEIAAARAADGIVELPGDEGTEPASQPTAPDPNR